MIPYGEFAVFPLTESVVKHAMTLTESERRIKFSDSNYESISDKLSEIAECILSAHLPSNSSTLYLITFFILVGIFLLLLSGFMIILHS